MPGLYYLFQHSDLLQKGDGTLIHMALATSMAIIVPTGLSSSWAQIKRKAVDWSSIKLMSPGLLVGVIIGISIVSKMDSGTLKLIFAIGLTLIALSIIFKRENTKSIPVLNRKICAYPSSIVFGILATFLGIGGAVLNVPYLNRAGLPLKTAIATGSVLGVIISFIATCGYLFSGEGTFGYIYAPAFLMIVPASVLTAPLGVKASHAISVSKLKNIFAALLIIVAVKMLFEAL